MLVQHVEHVRLVLGAIDGHPEAMDAVVVLDARVMAGDEHVAVELCRAIEQRSEPHFAIAFDARIRRESVEVTLCERVDDRLGELVHVVEHVVRDVELSGHPPGIFGVRQCAATRYRHGPVLTLPLLEGHADHVVTLLEHQRCGDRAVDAPRHRNECLHRAPPSTSATA